MKVMIYEKTVQLNMIVQCIIKYKYYLNYTKQVTRH